MGRTQWFCWLHVINFRAHHTVKSLVFDITFSDYYWLGLTFPCPLLSSVAKLDWFPYPWYKLLIYQNSEKYYRNLSLFIVVMLSFCLDLKSVTFDLRKVQGEFLFLIDRSGSMSGVNISRVKVKRPTLTLIHFISWSWIPDRQILTALLSGKSHYYSSNRRIRDVQA